MEELLYAEESYAIRGAVFEVYREVGCGFLEAVYQECLEKEFKLSDFFRAFPCLRWLEKRAPGISGYGIMAYIFSFPRGFDKNLWSVEIARLPCAGRNEFVPPYIQRLGSHALQTVGFRIVLCSASCGTKSTGET
jgi:hypothetical protein